MCVGGFRAVSMSAGMRCRRACSARGFFAGVEVGSLVVRLHGGKTGRGNKWTTAIGNLRWKLGGGALSCWGWATHARGENLSGCLSGFAAGPGLRPVGGYLLLFSSPL